MKVIRVFFRRFSAATFLASNTLKSSESGLSQDLGHFWPSRSLRKCRGVSSLSLLNLQDASFTRLRFLKCFLSRQCFARKPVNLLVWFCWDLRTLSIFWNSSFPEFLWPALVRLCPFRVYISVASILVSSSLRKASSRPQRF